MFVYVVISRATRAAISVHLTREDANYAASVYNFDCYCYDPYDCDSAEIVSVPVPVC